MALISRRNLLKTGVAGGFIAGSGLAEFQWLDWAKAWADEMPIKPEKGAKLRMLRYAKFFEAEETATNAAIKAFMAATGVEIRVDSEFLDDIQPKASVAANIGQGPDLVWAPFSVPHLFPEKLVDVSDVADYLGKKYGGWYPVIEAYGKNSGRWICIPTIFTPSEMTYRVSWMKEAGFEKFPETTDGFLALCKALAKIKHPAGFPFGHATGDANSWLHWLLWSHGGAMVDNQNRVAINSKETLTALEFARELYAVFIPGTGSWNDASNNKAMLAGEIGLTSNGMNIYGKALADGMPIAADIDHAPHPIGPVGRPTENHVLYPMMVFSYCKFPNAAKALITFLMEKPQYDNLMEGCGGFVAPCLRGFEDHPVWNKDPKARPFKEAPSRAMPVSHAGTLGYASAAVLADFVLVDMFAEAASGQITPKQAAEKAEKRARRYYSV